MTFVLCVPCIDSNTEYDTEQCFIQTFYQWEGQTQVLEMLRRGGINHQSVWHNKVKIQGGGGKFSPLPPPPPPPK